MKNLTFSSPFVAQETVNLLNSSAFIIPPGTRLPRNKSGGKSDRVCCALRFLSGGYAR